MIRQSPGSNPQGSERLSPPPSRREECVMIEVGKEYLLSREGGSVFVKVVDYVPGQWVTYRPARNSLVRGSCDPDYFLEHAIPAGAARTNGKDQA